jgi:translation initiation factor RLI1
MMGGRQVNSRVFKSIQLEEAIKTKVSTLSGGERNRLHAMTLKKKETFATR